LGKATKVVDGDTFDALINIGYDAFVAVRLRLLRINTPERKQPGWQEATDATRRAVEGKTLLITACRKDAFGRWLAEVEIDGIGNLSDWLLNEGLAKPYKEKK
jgi:micrococcal nuclease